MEHPEQGAFQSQQTEAKSALEQDLATAREAVTSLTNRIDSLEWYIAGLVATNCLLVPQTMKAEPAQAQAGDSHSTEDKA